MCALEHDKAGVSGKRAAQAVRLATDRPRTSLESTHFCFILVLRKYADDENGMFSGSIRELFLYVITSWQVIVVTIAIVVYIFLVNYVARTYHRPQSISKSRPKKVKAPKPEKVSSKKEENVDPDNDLGLDEE